MLRVRVVQMIAHQKVDVSGVWDGWVPTAFAVDVILAMLSAAVPRCASGWIFPRARNLVLYDGALRRVMQMAVMQIIDMTFVANGHVPAGCSVNVSMLAVFAIRVVRHVGTRTLLRTFRNALGLCAERCARRIRLATYRISLAGKRRSRQGPAMVA